MLKNNYCMLIKAFIGVYLVFLTITQAKSNGRFRIAYLEESSDTTANLVLLNVTKIGTKLERINDEPASTLVRNIVIPNKFQILTANQPSGLICWLISFILQCYNVTSSKERQYDLIQLSGIDRSKIRGGRIWDAKLDLHGNNVYWLLPSNNKHADSALATDLWVTSLSTNATKLISRGLTLEYLAVDDYNGYVFSYTNSSIEFCALPLVDTAPDQVECNKSKSFLGDTYVLGCAVSPVGRSMYSLHASFRKLSSRTSFLVPSIRASVYDQDWTGQTEKYSTAVRFRDWITSSSRLEFYKDNAYFYGEFDKLAPSKHKSIMAIDVNTHGKSPLNQWGESVDTTTDGFRNLSAFVIFEDKLQGVRNPCAALKCSHLCLPSFPKRHACKCPAGWALINNSTCEPPLFLAYFRNYGFRLHFVRNPEKVTRAYETCLVDFQTNVTSNSGNNNTKPCPPKLLRYLHRLPDQVTKTRSHGNFQLDPYTTGYVTRSNDSTCVLYCNTSWTCVTIKCQKWDRIFGFAMDFHRGLVLWFEGRLPLVLAHNLTTEHSANNSLGVRIPFSIFFSKVHEQGIISEEEFDIDKDVALDHEDGFQGVVAETVANASITFFQGYMYSYGKVDDTTSNNTYNAILQRDLDTQVSKIVIPDYSEQMQGFWVLPPESEFGFNQKLSPCFAAKCSHICIPTTYKQYKCGCPDPLGVSEGGGCESLDFLLVVSDGRETRLQIWNHGMEGFQEIFELMLDNATSVTLESANFLGCMSKRNFCWRLQTSLPEIRCVDVGIETGGEPVVVATIDSENSSMVLFGANEMEIYYDDGHFRNIWLQSNGSKFKFPAFDPGEGVELFAVDNYRQILVYTLSDYTLCAKSLYTELEPSCIVATKKEMITSVQLDSKDSQIYLVESKNIRRFSYESGNLEFLDLFYSTRENIIMPKSLHLSHEWLSWIEQNETQNYLMSHQVVTRKKLTTPFKLKQAGLKLKSTFILNQFNEFKEPPCANSNCSHFCFPEKPTSDRKFKCACPEDLHLDTDKKTCLLTVSAKIGTPTISVISTGSLLLVLFFFVMLLTLWRKKRTRERILQAIIDDMQKGNPEAAEKAKDKVERAFYLPLKCIIPATELSVDEKMLLGEGHFARIFKGTWEDKVVAVKRLKPSLNLNSLPEFVQEIKIMNYVGYNENVVRFYGVEVSGVKHFTMDAVMEYSHMGSLQKYLRAASQGSNQAGSSEVRATKRMLTWALHIANGMRHLAEKQVVHGDLAARNVLVFPSELMKICDFGFSIKLYQAELHQKNEKAELPVGWMALECLEFLEFSTKSDVWAFGVTLWEIFTGGETPFPGFKWQGLKRHLKEGNLLDRPEAAPTGFYDNVMKPCWNLNRNCRPDFNMLLSLIDGAKRALVSQEPDGYEAVLPSNLA